MRIVVPGAANRARHGQPRPPAASRGRLRCTQMRAMILDAESAGLDALLERRRRSGLDRLDEVWGGVLHMVPAPSYAHARVAHQLDVLLDGPARAAGLVPVMGEFNLGESERDYRVPDG